MFSRLFPKLISLEVKFELAPELMKPRKAF